MNRTNLLLALLAIIFSSVSCDSSKSASHENQKEESMQQNGAIQLEDVWNSEGTINLSAIAASIEYIPLKMTNDPLSVLPGSKKLIIEMTMDYFIIFDHQSSVRVFSANGEFICSIGSLGKGPGEYLGVGKILVTNNENQLWIFDYRQKKMIRYDFSGRFINEFKIDGKSSQATIDPDGDIHIVELEREMSIMDSSKIVVYSNDGKVKHSFSLYEDRRLGPGSFWGMVSHLRYVNGAVEHFEPPYDTVFRYENGRWKAIWSLHPGSKRIPFEAYSERTFNDVFHPYSFISNILETPDHFFIDGVHKQRMKKILVDKLTLSAQPCDFTTEKLEQVWRFQGLSNDLDGGIPFWPTAAYQNDYLISMFDPLMLKSFEPAISDASEFDQKNRAKLDELIESLDPEGNPIIMLVKLK